MTAATGSALDQDARSVVRSGFGIVEPGVARTAEWRVEEHDRIGAPERAEIWAAVGRRR